MGRKNWTLEMANKWKNYKPPIRPSKYDLEVFEDFIKKKIKKYGKETKILILGSTPEFRDLASKHKLIPYVVDYNELNNKALALLKKHKGKEFLIKQDWKKLKLKEKFDLVFGEASITVLKEKDIPIVLKNVKNILKQDGLFISKTWVRVSKRTTLKKIIEFYRKHYKGKNMKNHMNQQLHSLDHDGDICSLKKQYFRFKILYEKGIITKQEFSSIEGLGYETTPLVLFMPLKKKMTKILKKYMKVVKIIYPQQIGTNKIPIYVLGK